MNSINDIALSFLEGINPTSIMTVTEWANKYRKLSSLASAEHGTYNVDRTPYLKEVMDKLSPSDPCQEVIVQKGVQEGFTEAALNAVGAFMDIAPCSIMYVMPTIDMAKSISKERLKCMIEACESLSQKIKPNRERDANNNILSKEFPGGILNLTGANSSTGLSSRPVRLLIFDETDRYPLDIDEQGSPISQGKNRTITFPNRKIFMLSTPTVTGKSAIEREIETTDKRKYFVPLPCCGGYQTLEFENLVWTGDMPDNVKYKCVHCGELVEERFKPKFMDWRVAEWRPTDSKYISPKRAGYIINSLYSPLGWLSWTDIVKQYLVSKDDPLLYAAFIQTILAQTTKVEGEAPPWENIYNRREKYKIGIVPKDVVFLSCGIDVQKDRIELEVVGWGKGKQSWSVDYRVLLGETTMPDVWDQLAKVLKTHYIKENGVALPIKLSAIDTGYNTTHVYDFCRKFSPTQLIPIKGRDSLSTIFSQPKAIDTSRHGKSIGHVKVWSVGSSILKQELYGLLALNVLEDGTYPDGYCHFPEYESHYFKGLTGEQLQFKVVNGFRKYEWVKKYERNEPLDCRNYARAAAAVLGMDRFTENDWKILSESSFDAPQVKPKKNVDDYWG